MTTEDHQELLFDFLQNRFPFRASYQNSRTRSQSLCRQINKQIIIVIGNN